MSYVSITIEPYMNNYKVYEHGIYEDNSVLAGQHKRRFLDMYEKTEAGLLKAREDYPCAKVLDFISDHPKASVPLNPPADFDPMDAGERWDENY